MNKFPFLADIFAATAALHSRRVNRKMEAFESTSEKDVFFNEVFRRGGCSDYLREQYDSCRCPLYLYDDLYFLWAAVPQIQSGQTQALWLLGPVCSSKTDKSFIKPLLDKYHFPLPVQKELLEAFDSVPLLPTAYLGHYLRQSFYVLNGELPEIPEFQFQILKPEKAFEPAGSPPYEQNYYRENLLLKKLEQGIPVENFTAYLSSVSSGLMCPGNPLRQKKDEAICLITLLTRAGIRGGYPAEKAYSLSDHSIQIIESLDSIEEINQVTERMYLDILETVRLFQKRELSDPVVRDCIGYIDTHLEQKIELDSLADYLGYDKYYISARFKKAVGLSLNQYVNRQKIALAKVLLASPDSVVQNISDRLCFANPSYFAMLFKKETGLTPLEYKHQTGCLESRRQ